MKSKLTTILTFLMLSAGAFAKTALDSTKQDAANSISKASSPAPWMPLVQLAFTIAILYGFIRFVGPKILSKIGGKLNPKADSLLLVEESATLAQGSLYVVSIYGQQYLVGAANSGINCLANLTEARMAFQQEQDFFETLDEKVEEAPETWPIDNEMAQIMAQRLDDLAAIRQQDSTKAAVILTEFTPSQEQVHPTIRPPYWAVTDNLNTQEQSTPAQAQQPLTNQPQATHLTLQNPFAEAMQQESSSTTRSTVLSENSPVDPLSRLEWITGGRSSK